MFKEPWRTNTSMACLFRNEIEVPWMEAVASVKSLTFGSSTRSEKTDIMFDQAFSKVQ